jgi:hypothetical protein
MCLIELCHLDLDLRLRCDQEGVFFVDAGLRHLTFVPGFQEGSVTDFRLLVEGLHAI